MSDCLFCKMVNGDIPIDRVYEDDKTIAFRDINPQAPCHILVIPKEHFNSIHLIPESSGQLHSDLMSAVTKIVVSENLVDSGYRVVINSGKDGGQEVDHLHYHILGGRSLQWPPG